MNNLSKTSICQQCKGKGYYSGYLKTRDNYHAAIDCDFPGCHNGIVNKEENHRITSGNCCKINLK